MFETAIPCIVEIMGHNQIAGMVSEQAVGGTALIRVDVPAVDDRPAFTKFYNVAAIYAITPTDEPTMLQAVKAFRVKPIEAYRLQIAAERVSIEAGGQYDIEDIDDDDDGYGDDDPDDGTSF
jgi:hypothetical protein